MAIEPKGKVSVLNHLADETLQHILDFAMTRDSPFYIDDPHLGHSEYWSRKRTCALNMLESSTGEKDPLFIQVQNSCHPVHQHAPQSVHRTDWIAINSTNRRIRTLGKASFFQAKTIAIHAELPARLQRNDFKRMSPNDQALALSCITDIVIVDALEASPDRILQLPRTLAFFQNLRRCTLLFGYSTSKGGEDDAEWIAVAFALGGPVPIEMQKLMTAIGISRSFKLEEAMGPGWTWASHRDTVAKYIYPTLGIKAKLLSAKEEHKKKEERDKKQEYEEMKSSQPSFGDNLLMSKL